MTVFTVEPLGTFRCAQSDGVGSHTSIDGGVATEGSYVGGPVVVPGVCEESGGVTVRVVRGLTHTTHLL